jgi:hypothetical protein
MRLTVSQDVVFTKHCGPHHEFIENDYFRVLFLEHERDSSLFRDRNEKSKRTEGDENGAVATLTSHPDQAETLDAGHKRQRVWFACQSCLKGL